MVEIIIDDSVEVYNMKWLYKKDLTDINSIKKVEDAFGIRFPSDYKDIVLAYNAATPWSC
ncbi:hypothetical protein BCL90_5264 [Pedobacter alluvionis]|uniref:SMI1/KNR4 family protein n=2 Tax=Pedobacter alluvionis TaxID=475253 RepID=A0A497XRK2_9SPHI|nr:SMI1/KNR4 family protein [Pedobacter alluvionis]RLJ69342.1 hypothetical protein BCL90_5264 [Pedobacter alluvionis]